MERGGKFGALIEAHMLQGARSMQGGTGWVVGEEAAGLGVGRDLKLRQR
jgi:N-acetylglucosamine kinase-like BadF-type ATPase